MPYFFSLVWEHAPFSDVRADAPYYDAVMWALESDVTAGTSATTFAPGATCNRGQVATFLWRAAGQPEPTSYNNPFSDVNSSSFCYKAVLWAVQQEITNGTSDSTFSPGNSCTYAHVLTFLWRSAGSPESAERGAYAGRWYADALAWANENGILKGATFTPENPCPRSDIVSFLYRWARPAELSRYPELAADRTPIPESELSGTYRDGNFEFIVELQGGVEGDKQELSFVIQDARTGDFVGGCERVGVNFYKSDVDSSGEFAVGFSRADGVIYLDYYRNNVHIRKIPREPFEAMFDVSGEESVWLGDYVGEWTGADDSRYELTIDFAGLRDDVEYCEFHLDYRGRLSWDGLCAFDGVRGVIVVSDVQETAENYNKYTGESSPETYTLDCHGIIALQDDGSLWMDVSSDDGNLEWVLEDIDGRFVKNL